MPVFYLFMCTCVYICVCMYVYVCMYMYVCVHVCICACLCDLCMHVCMCLLISASPSPTPQHHHQALSYHIYCLDTLPLPHIACTTAYDLGWGAITTSLARTGGGGMLTEFGAVSESDVDLFLIDSMLDATDKHMQSWCG